MDLRITGFLDLIHRPEYWISETQSYLEFRTMNGVQTLSNPQCYYFPICNVTALYIGTSQIYRNAKLLLVPSYTKRGLLFHDVTTEWLCFILLLLLAGPWEWEQCRQKINKIDLKKSLNNYTVEKVAKTFYRDWNSITIITHNTPYWKTQEK
jgi:hypothetical protein